MYAQRSSLAWLNLIAFAAMVLVNGFANTLPLAGRTTAEVSAQFPTLFTPAGFTFSIWGVIYLGLGAFVGLGLLRPDSPAVQRIGGWFAASCALNLTWLLAWHHLEITLSMAVMLGLLASLVAVYQRIGRGPRSRVETWAVGVPFSLYLGWVTVATLANTAIWLAALGWRGAPLPEASWTVFLVAVATAIGLVTLRRHGDFAYNLVLVWALVGIAAARATEVLPVTVAALIGAALLLVAGLARTLPHKPPDMLVSQPRT